MCKDDLTNTKILTFFLLVLVLGSIILFYEDGPTLYFTIKSWISGKEAIQELARITSEYENNIIDVFHGIADWEKENIEYDPSGTYYIGFLKVHRKIPPNAEYTIFVKRGACDEYSYLFKAIVEKLGYECRVVKNSGEDHAWNEIHLNGTWIHFDSTLTYENRFNNSDHYERSTSEGGWGKNLSYVYYKDKNGEICSVTERYTDIGKIIIDFNSTKFPLFGVQLIIKSKSLMEWRPDKFKNPKICYNQKIQKKDRYAYEFGGNNYIILIKWGIFKENTKMYEISLKENSILYLPIIF